ncbi:hypothetical protein HCJ76_44850 [Streptomyces sp. MC1]|nr:hypothetical protein [Streptomyces sp. MC1]MBG7705007.1 hypothetical protein [Streptomyces sp. MC1]
MPVPDPRPCVAWRSLAVRTSERRPPVTGAWAQHVLLGGIVLLGACVQ